MNLFQRQLTSQARQDLLAYYEQACIITAFQDSESERYNRAVAEQSGRPDTGDSFSPLMESAARMLLANRETVKRFEQLHGWLPPLATAHFSNWYGLFVMARQWSVATYENLNKITQGIEPDREKVQSALKVMDDIRRKAEAEARKLVQRIRLTATEAKEITQAIEDDVQYEHWTPESFVLKEAMEVLTMAIDGLAAYEMVLGSWLRQSSDLSGIDKIVREIWLPDWRELIGRLGEATDVNHYPCDTDLRMKLPMLYFRFMAFDMELMRTASNELLDGTGRAEALKKGSADLKAELTESKEWAKIASEGIGMDASSFLSAASQRSFDYWKPRMESLFGAEQFQRMREWASCSPMNRWRVTYRDLSGTESKYYEVDAITDHEAVGAFMEYVDKNQITLSLPTIGEEEGQPVLGLEVSVLSGGLWVNPDSVGL